MEDSCLRLAFLVRREARSHQRKMSRVVTRAQGVLGGRKV